MLFRFAQYRFQAIEPAAGGRAGNPQVTTTALSVVKQKSVNVIEQLLFLQAWRRGTFPDRQKLFLAREHRRFGKRAPGLGRFASLKEERVEKASLNVFEIEG